MSTKLGKVVTYNEELLLIKLVNSTITWFCEVTWQISTLYLYLLETNGHQTWQGVKSPWGASTYKFIWFFKHLFMRGPRDKLKTSPLLQCLWSQDLSGWWHITRSFVWPLIEGIKWGHLTNQIHISTCRRSIDINLLRCRLKSEASILKIIWSLVHFIFWLIYILILKGLIHWIALYRFEIILQNICLEITCHIFNFLNNYF